MAFRHLQQFFYCLTIVLILASCRKAHAPSPLPANDLQFSDLNDREVKYKGPAAIIDLNKDNEPDLVFGVLPVGDPLNNVDKTQFRVSSGIFTRLPVNHLEQVPMLDRSDTVFLNNFNGYNWYEISSVILVEKVEDVAGTIVWRGNWQTAAKNYLPVQVLKNEQRFNGWVELSFDLANEKIILHRAAISKHPERNTRAGI